MSVSVFPNWRIWVLNPNATIDECLILSMGLNPEISWLKESEPFNDSLDYWNQPAMRNSGSGAGLGMRTQSVELCNTEDWIKERLKKCKWAQAFPNLNYEERISKHSELQERALIVGKQKYDVEKFRIGSRRLAGLTPANVTFYFFHTKLGFEMPAEVMSLVEAALQIIGPSTSKEPNSKSLTQLPHREKNSYSALIFALLSQLEKMDEKKFPFPWNAGTNKNLNQEGINRAIDLAGVKLNSATTRKILLACKEWAESNDKTKS